jgi:LysM repeat protein
LSRIARVFQVTVSQILSWNGLGSAASIQPGQKLMILVARRS